MRIRVTGHSGEGKFPFGESGPWKEFENAILARGHEICESNFDSQSDAIITNSFNQKIEDFLAYSKIPIDKRILVNWEPYIVERTRYTRNVLNIFAHRFAPSVDWAEKISGISFKWPQDEIIDESVFDNWKTRSNCAVMIQGNKFSARKGELYSLRRRLIKTMNPESISLFGTNWNSGFKFDWWHWSRSAMNSKITDIDFKSIVGVGRKYVNYAGPVADKQMIMTKFRISIVIENSADFVSEKLFDSVRAGCVSIYVGPELERYGIPTNTAISVCPDHKSIMEKVAELQKMDQSELKSIATAQFRALSSVAGEWTNTVVLRKLANDMIALIER
jgi:hypothetical protein